MRKFSISYLLARSIVIVLVITLTIGSAISVTSTYFQYHDIRNKQKINSVQILAKLFEHRLENFDFSSSEKILENEGAFFSFGRIEVIDLFGVKQVEYGVDAKEYGSPDFSVEVKGEEGHYLGKINVWNGTDTYFEDIWLPILVMRIFEVLVILLACGYLLRRIINKQIVRPLGQLQKFISDRSFSIKESTQVPENISDTKELVDIASSYIEASNKLIQVKEKQSKEMEARLQIQSEKVFQHELLEQVLMQAKTTLVYTYNIETSPYLCMGSDIPYDLKALLMPENRQREPLEERLKKSNFETIVISSENSNLNNYISIKDKGDKVWTIKSLHLVSNVHAYLCIDTTDEYASDRRQSQQQKMAAIGSLSSGIAHDFNNLLTIISASLEQMHIGKSNVLMQNSMFALERGKGLIRQLLSFAHDKKSIKKVINQKETLHYLENILPPTLGPHYNVVVESRTNEKVNTDGDLLETCIINLATNSRDAMMEANIGSTIKVISRDATKADLLSANINEDKKYVAFDVIDDGPGIEKEYVSRVFDPFFSTKEIGKGTGLGLSITYSFAERAGGSVYYSANEPQGARFTILLPVSDKQNIGTLPSKKINGKIGSILKKLNVLVVDDETAIASLLEKYLTNKGANVAIASGLNSTIEFTHNTNNIRPDIVISDLHLKDGNGFEIFQKVSDAYGVLPLVLISGNVGMASQVKKKFSGQYEMLEKPFQLHELDEVIGKAIGDFSQYDLAANDKVISV